MTSGELRESFLAFFEERGHRRVRSSSLIPAGDPTLLFTNAGMVQFKNVFLGSEKRDYARATTSQKCVRAGGKHNDLENVGRTSRHHTFFEMLGNFSFGDYFKKEAIPFAWDYLTRVIGLPVDRLWVTVFHDDDEAAGIWERDVGVDSSRIVRLGEKDNFWAMGETGPCGPCSEILIDQGESVGCGRPECAVGCDCDRYLELWNLVFMQFDRDAEGRLAPLPKPSIDTGMGLERLAAVVQGKTSNFDTDLFVPIINFIEQATDASYGGSDQGDVSIRVIADHLRSMAFLISDGVMPSNEGRGYVLRRIMRRACRHAYLLGASEPFINRGVPVLAQIMGEAYPELREHATYTQGIIRREEERFMDTLDSGMGILTGEMERLGSSGSRVIPGETVFRLYDTYGFPVDLSEEISREKGFSLDMEGFDRLMEEQRSRARAAWAGSGEEGLRASLRELAGTLPPTSFTGYRGLEEEAVVTALLVGDEKVEEAPAGSEVEVVLDRSPFYGESGGQLGETGVLSGEGATVEVRTTLRPTEALLVHVGRVAEGRVRVGQRLKAVVDAERRRASAANHTATHLLQAALRRILGDHVKQSGSLVTPERLRFDFTNPGPVPPDDLREVERLVNGVIRDNTELCKETMSLDEAMKSGATAIFGEKYGEEVRVVTVPEFSAEFCGGIHVERTGDIGLFRILSESGVAAGVRRIEALTGPEALKTVQEEDRLLGELTGLLKVGRNSLPERVRRMTEEVRELERQLERSKASSERSVLDTLLAEAREVNGVSVLVASAEGVEVKGLRGMVDQVKDRRPDSVTVLATVSQGKLAMVGGVAGKAAQRVNAGELVGRLAQSVGGRGGGRPDFAQAGAPDGARLGEVLAEARRLLDEMLAP